MASDEHVPEPPTDPGDARPRRSAPAPAVRVNRYELAAGEGFGFHAHAEHQFVWAATGAVRVRAAEDRWTLAPTLLAWLPGGVPHDVVVGRPTAVYCAYLDPDRGLDRLRGVGPSALAATSLVRELLLYLAHDAPFGDPARGHAEALLLASLRRVEVRAVAPPVPRDDRAAAVARGLLEHPADGRSLGDWGRHAGASARTLARVFVAETGLTFAEWRTHGRVDAAQALLAEGVPVAVVARRVGYASSSAFVAAYRRTTGHTPGSAFGAPGAP